jgi:hypothetical protein
MTAETLPSEFLPPESLDSDIFPKISSPELPSVSDELVSSVKVSVESGLDFASDFPALAEAASMGCEKFLAKSEDQAFCDSLRSEMLDCCIDLQKRRPSHANRAFVHFVGNASNAFHAILRNRKARHIYSGVVSEIPAFARIVRIIMTSAPKSVYVKIVSESERRVEHREYSWQDWIIASSRFMH